MSDNLFVLKREASREPFVFEVDGESFSIPHVGEVDQFDLAELFTRSDAMSDLQFIVAFFELLMTPKDFKRLRALKLNRDSLVDLYKAVNKHTGESLGESPASSK